MSKKSKREAEAQIDSASNPSKFLEELKNHLGGQDPWELVKWRDERDRRRRKITFAMLAFAFIIFVLAYALGRSMIGF